MKKILVIAGGDWQVELVKKAKQMGHYVICSNLYEDSPAFRYVDVCEVADVLDREKNLKIAEKYMPDAIISDQSDIAVPTVAYLNEKLGLRGIGTKMAELFTNKYRLREFCRKNGIMVPDYKLCKTGSDAESMLEKYGKIIIKPVDSQSSRGVFTISNRNDLEKYYEESLSYSNNMKAFLAEEYVGGSEFTVDGIVSGGRHYPLCISIKEMYLQNPNISKMQVYTYSHPKYDYNRLRQENRELVMKTGLPFGLTHSEYKFYNGRFYLIEAGARGGGSNLSAKIVPFLSEIDNYEYLIKSALGENIELDLQNVVLPREKCAVMRFFDFGEGKVEEVKGKEYLESNDKIMDYQLNVKVGDILKNPAYGRQRPGHFIIGGNDKKQLMTDMNEVLSKVSVRFEKAGGLG